MNHHDSKQQREQQVSSLAGTFTQVPDKVFVGHRSLEPQWPPAHQKVIYDSKVSRRAHTHTHLSSIAVEQRSMKVVEACEWSSHHGFVKHQQAMRLGEFSDIFRQGKVVESNDHQELSLGPLNSKTSRPISARPKSV